jgi:aspartyl/glutamyl-tRNA(Asn/Gln) amidotransferase C subunit
MKTHTIPENETKNLAMLARLGLTDAEHVSFKKDIESILGFIDTIQDVSANTPLQQVGFAPIGGVRDDAIVPVEGSFSAQEIVSQSPSHADNAVKVKKILA